MSASHEETDKVTKSLSATAQSRSDQLNQNTECGSTFAYWTIRQSNVASWAHQSFGGWPRTWIQARWNALQLRNRRATLDWRFGGAPLVCHSRTPISTSFIHIAPSPLTMLNYQVISDQRVDKITISVGFVRFATFSDTFFPPSSFIRPFILWQMKPFFDRPIA